MNISNIEVKMKRKSILIGNTDGLPGVKVDITNFKSFLSCEVGGCWLESEIEIFHDPKKIDIMKKIDNVRREKYDYVIVLFSGHGGYKRQTVLQINKNNDTINESDIMFISSRQLNVYDCCRCHIEPVTEGLALDRSFGATTRSIESVRLKYDNRIMQSIPQQSILYSCSVGESSNDTPNGGVYLQNLLKSARNVRKDQEFKLVGLAHDEAASLVKDYNRNSPYKQNPESILPKCLPSQQLIISLATHQTSTFF